MGESKVSVIVVSYNTRDKLRHCLSCIEPEHEVIVVDNASDDGSADMVVTDFPRVLLHRSEENLGFGPANNVGAKMATRELLLFLNSDAYAQPGAINAQAAVFAEPLIVAAGGRQLNTDGTLQQSTAERLRIWAIFLEQTFLEKLILKTGGSAYWNTSRLFRQWQKTQQPQPTEQVMGATLMMRSSLEERFDERFFLYCEDTDLCHRLRRHGEIVYAPDAVYTHDLGSSSSKEPWRGVARYNVGKELYFAIHSGPSAFVVCLLLDRLGALLRLVLWGTATLVTLARIATFRRRAEIFWRVLTAKVTSYPRPPTGQGRTPYGGTRIR